MACIPVITPGIIRCFNGELRDREKRAGNGSVTNGRLLAARLFNETWRLMEQEHGPSRTTTA